MNAPSLLVVGVTIANDASNAVFVGTTNPLRIGVPEFTWNTAVIDPDTKLTVLA